MVALATTTYATQTIATFCIILKPPKSDNTNLQQRQQQQLLNLNKVSAKLLS
eukprot:m.4996 g.4996  ORF g.4996 m.4996 type:complete len:52 (-) comp3156_c0_seq1:42-197(-)